MSESNWECGTPKSTNNAFSDAKRAYKGEDAKWLRKANANKNVSYAASSRVTREQEEGINHGIVHGLSRKADERLIAIKPQQLKAYSGAVPKDG
jgi:hypothetical protein